jgi:DNA-directed RNA polymerase specialized sigma24 family protein
MYARFHTPLVASVRAFLGPAGRDPYLIDEVAARVWYALVRDDFWLLARFDIRRGCRLSTFLSLIAKAQARLLLRSERRRRVREQAVAKFEIEEPAEGRLDSLSGEEFVATLSPAERTFGRCAGGLVRCNAVLATRIKICGSSSACARKTDQFSMSQFAGTGWI